jgi:hypothetical protein
MGDECFSEPIHALSLHDVIILTEKANWIRRRKQNNLGWLISLFRATNCSTGRRRKCVRGRPSPYPLPRGEADGAAAGEGQAI